MIKIKSSDWDSTGMKSIDYDTLTQKEYNNQIVTKYDFIHNMELPNILIIGSSHLHAKGLFSMAQLFTKELLEILHNRAFEVIIYQTNKHMIIKENQLKV